MTLAATSNRVLYDCDGTTTAFPFTFKIFDEDDITVILLDDDDNETTLVTPTNYTVTKTGNDFDSGGNVETQVLSGGTFIPYAYPVGYKILIIREIELNQETVFPLAAESYEDTLDRLTMITQQIEEKVGRSPKFKITSSESDVEIEDLEAGAVLAVNSTGDGIEMGPTADEITDAQTYATAALAAQVAAETAEDGAQAAQVKAEEWAEEPEDFEVETGKYSAKHYAAKAATSAASIDVEKLAGIEAGADVTDAGNVAAAIHGATAKTTPVDADEIGGIDTEAANVLKKHTWNNIKAFLKTYFDSIYNALVSDDSYAAAWNGVGTIAPSKNAVYDKIESVITSITDKVSDTAYAAAWDGITTIAPSKNAVYDKMQAMAKTAINFMIPDEGAAISTGIKGKGGVRVPFACTIIGWVLTADQSGSLVIDIWKDIYANFPPTVADTITASAKPTLSSAIKNSSSTLTGWTTTISEGDYLFINVDSCTTCREATLSLLVTRT